MPVFESSRKVQVFGSSLAMTLPSLFVKANEVKKGSVSQVYYDLEGVLIATWLEEPESLRKCVLEIIEMLNETNSDLGKVNEENS